MEGDSVGYTPDSLGSRDTGAGVARAWRGRGAGLYWGGGLEASSCLAGLLGLSAKTCWQVFLVLPLNLLAWSTCWLADSLNWLPYSTCTRGPRCKKLVLVL
eukprot:gene8382-biopygen21148